MKKVNSHDVTGGVSRRRPNGQSFKQILEANSATVVAMPRLFLRQETVLMNTEYAE